MSNNHMRKLAFLMFTAIVPSLAVAEEARPYRKDSRFPQPKQARLTPYTNPKVLKPGQTFTYNIRVSLDDGWRILAFSPEHPPGGPFWTRFDLFDTGGFEVVSDWHASMPATVKRDPAFPDRQTAEQTVELFEKEVTWSIRLKVPQGMEPGEKTLRCQAAYQLMDESVITAPGRWTVRDVRVKVGR